MIITRSLKAETAVYPIVETVQRDHICQLVRAPAPVSEQIAAAADVARRAVEAVDAVGSFGVEMFLTHGGGIVVNELAPRGKLMPCINCRLDNHPYFHPSRPRKPVKRRPMLSIGSLQRKSAG